MRIPVYSQGATPIGYSRPPDNGPRKTHQNHTNSANPVYKTTGRSKQQVLVKVDYPFDRGNKGGRPLQFVTVDNHAASNAHQNYVHTESCTHPQMNVEKALANPHTLRVVQPSLPSGHFLLPTCKL